MELKNARLWNRYSTWEAVRDSALAITAAFAIRYYLHDWIEPYAPYHFFMVACIAVAIRHGYKTAFLSLCVCVFLGNFFFIKPYFRVGQLSRSDLIQVLNFFMVTTIAIGVIEKLQRTICSQRLLIQVMNDRHRSMLYQRNELEYRLRSLKNGES